VCCGLIRVYSAEVLNFRNICFLSENFITVLLEIFDKPGSFHMVRGSSIYSETADWIAS